MNLGELIKKYKIDAGKTISGNYEKKMPGGHITFTTIGNKILIQWGILYFDSDRIIIEDEIQFELVIKHIEEWWSSSFSKLYDLRFLAKERVN